MYTYIDALHLTTSQDITLEYITVHHITIHYSTVQCAQRRYITLHYIALHYFTLLYVTLHYLHYITTCIPRNYIAMSDWMKETYLYLCLIHIATKNNESLLKMPLDGMKSFRRIG